MFNIHTRDSIYYRMSSLSEWHVCGSNMHMISAITTLCLSKSWSPSFAIDTSTQRMSLFFRVGSAGSNKHTMSYSELYIYFNLAGVWRLHDRYNV